MMKNKKWSKEDYVQQQAEKKQKREEQKTKEALAGFDYDRLMGSLEAARINHKPIGLIISGVMFMIYVFVNLGKELFNLTLYYGSPFIVEDNIILYALFNLFMFLTAIGLFMLNRWARISAILLSIVVVFFHLDPIVSYVKMHSKPGYSPQILISMSLVVCFLLIILYLLRIRISKSFH